MLPVYDMEFLTAQTVACRAVAKRHIADQQRPYLMQFTGLLDKAGQEIYEDDLISLDQQWAHLIGAGRTLCKVGFRDGCFMFGRSDICPEDLDTMLWVTAKYATVVGNIWQTPTWHQIAHPGPAPARNYV